LHLPRRATARVCPFYVVAFVKLLVTRRLGRTGPAGSFFSGHYELGESDVLFFSQSCP
jgi:hypothetical protein